MIKFRLIKRTEFIKRLEKTAYNVTIITGIGKIMRGLKTLNKEFSFGTNLSSVPQFVL